MTVPASQSRKIPRLSALDPDLAFLASQAAIELDALLSQRSTELAAVRELAEQLRNSITLSSADGGPQSLMDPATLSVLGEAMNRTHPTQTVTRIRDLVSRAAAIADDLQRSDPIRDRERLEWAREFCVSLSKTAAAYRKSIYDLRPAHPFRR